jgi:hypothetical protein
MLLEKIHRRPTFGYKYIPQGEVKKSYLHLAFAFATVQLLFFLRSQTVLHRSMDHGKSIAGNLPEENLPLRRRLQFQGYGKIRSDFNFHLVLLTPLLFCSGDHLGAVHDAHSTAHAGSSFDSYNGDNARCFRCEWHAAIDRYSKATRQNGQLEFALNASQATLSAAEGEANMVWAQLAESDARVAGKTFKAPAFFIASISLVF